MIRTIKEVYDLIVEKRDNARQYLEKQNDELYRQGMLGNINAYNDVLSLIESSHLLEEDKPIKSKDLTPLEALNIIQYLCSTNINKYYFIIEKALKEYELIKQTKIIVSDREISDEDLEKLKNQRVLVDSLKQGEIKPLFDEETQKKLKALEIIKSKNIDTSILKSSSSLEFYTYWACSNQRQNNLTKEEYDLLKEVLL